MKYTIREKTAKTDVVSNATIRRKLEIVNNEAHHRAALPYGWQVTDEFGDCRVYVYHRGISGDICICESVSRGRSPNNYWSAI